MSCSTCSTVREVYRKHYAGVVRVFEQRPFYRILLFIIAKMWKHPTEKLNGNLKRYMDSIRYIRNRTNFKQIYHRLSYVVRYHDISRLNLWHILAYYVSMFPESEFLYSECSENFPENLRLFLKHFLKWRQNRRTLDGMSYRSMPLRKMFSFTTKEQFDFANTIILRVKPTRPLPVEMNGIGKETEKGEKEETEIKKEERVVENNIDPYCYQMAEFLQAYEIDTKCTNLFEPRGLLNSSNYCYINSILQALIACPPLANLLVALSDAALAAATNEKRKPTPMIDGMCRFVKEFKLLPPNQHSRNTKEKRAEKSTKKDANANVSNTAHLANTDAPFEPIWIYKMLNGLRTDLIEGRQEDAEEFLGVLLNSLNNEMLEIMVPKNKGSKTRSADCDHTPISAIFGGLLRSRVHRDIQPFFTLQLNIEKVKTVREALDALVSKHQLEGVTSLKTNEQVESYQQVLLDELPIILILHLKCFDYKQDGCTKIVKQLEFGVDLRIDEKLLSSKLHLEYEKHYKLFAVIYHDGKEASNGHYVTDAFHVGLGCWLRYHNAAVKTVTEEAVLKPHGSRVPYFLFYRRVESLLRK